MPKVNMKKLLSQKIKPEETFNTKWSAPKMKFKLLFREEKRRKTVS